MILVVVEPGAGDGALRPGSAEAVSFARAVAATSGTPLHAVAVGAGASAVAASLRGPAVLHAVGIDGPYAPAAWGRAVTEVMDATTPRLVLAAATDRGHEMLAHVAATRDVPMLANCTDVEPADPLVATRQRWGGTVLEEVRVTSPTVLVSIAPGSVPAHGGEETETDAPVVEERTLEPSGEDLRARLLRTEPPAAGGVALAQARVVVGGGRGVGSAEEFASLEDLASLLEGAVGVSRAVTSAGWRPHAEQIGQTGVRIAPALYIACGVSGASQHMVGCAGAERILAINTDGEAPIMARADHAVIGDLHEVVPAIAAEVRRRLGS
jgi:electron transfer flavoprotein alpha subunit